MLAVVAMDLPFAVPYVTHFFAMSCLRKKLIHAIRNPMHTHTDTRCPCSRTTNAYTSISEWQGKSEPSNSMIAFYCQRIKRNKNETSNSSSRGDGGGSTRRGHHTCRDRNKNVMYIFILGIALPISFARLANRDEYYSVYYSASFSCIASHFISSTSYLLALAYYFILVGLSISFGRATASTSVRVWKNWRSVRDTDGMRSSFGVCSARAHICNIAMRSIDIKTQYGWMWFMIHGSQPMPSPRTHTHTLHFASDCGFYFMQTY